MIKLNAGKTSFEIPDSKVFPASVFKTLYHLVLARPFLFFQYLIFLRISLTNELTRRNKTNGPTMFPLSSRWRAESFTRPTIHHFSASDKSRQKRAVAISSPENKEASAAQDGDEQRLVPDRKQENDAGWRHLNVSHIHSLLAEPEGPETAWGKKAGRSRQAPGGNTVTTSDIQRITSVGKSSAISNKGFL